MKFSDPVKNLVSKRARERCEVCGGYAVFAQIHHRRPRGMGGSKDPACGTAANGIWVHPSCHERIERSRKDAYENGWLVHQGHDPAQVPLKRWNSWVLLMEDGTMRLFPSKEHASLGGRPPLGS